MSKRRPDKLYEVLNKQGEKVVVLARHAKGARTAAREYLKGITSMSPVAELPLGLVHMACNRKGV